MTNEENAKKTSPMSPPALLVQPARAESTNMLASGFLKHLRTSDVSDVMTHASPTGCDQRSLRAACAKWKRGTGWVPDAALHHRGAVWVFLML